MLLLAFLSGSDGVESQGWKRSWRSSIPINIMIACQVVRFALKKIKGEFGHFMQREKVPMLEKMEGERGG